MMPLLIALLVAVFPPSMELAGTAGQTVHVPLKLVGTGDVRIEASEPLRLQEDLRIDGPMDVDLQARIAPGAEPGIYESYVYILPEGDAPLVTGQAVRTRVSVDGRPSAFESVPGTEGIASRGAWMWAAIAAAIVIAGFSISRSVKITRERT